MPDILVEPNDTAAALREYVRENPSIRKDAYDIDDVDPVEGACYVLAEAFFHAQGGTDSGLEVYRLDWSDVDENATGAHWFLRRDDGHTVIDLSLPSPSAGDAVPWNEARHRAFITGYTPSKRTLRVLDALGLPS